MSKRRIVRWLPLSAAVAWVLGSAAGARAQVSIRIQGGHHPGGSIRFGAPPPRPVVPVVPPGSVRYEHYHERDRLARPLVAPPGPSFYRHPYSEAYFRRFRPGYRTLVIGPTQYYAYPAPPLGYQTVVVNGVTYYFFDGVYYQPYIYQGQTVYMVVPPPIP